MPLCFPFVTMSCIKTSWGQDEGKPRWSQCGAKFKGPGNSWKLKTLIGPTNTSIVEQMIWYFEDKTKRCLYSPFACKDIEVHQVLMLRDGMKQAITSLFHIPSKKQTRGLVTSHCHPICHVQPWGAKLNPMKSKTLNFTGFHIRRFEFGILVCDSSWGAPKWRAIIAEHMVSARELFRHCAWGGMAGAYLKLAKANQVPSVEPQEKAAESIKDMM